MFPDLKADRFVIFNFFEYFITSVFILGEEILIPKLISFIIIWVGIVLYIYDSLNKRTNVNNIQ